VHFEYYVTGNLCRERLICKRKMLCKADPWQTTEKEESDTTISYSAEVARHIKAQARDLLKCSDGGL